MKKKHKIIDKIIGKFIDYIFSRPHKPEKKEKYINKEKINKFLKNNPNYGIIFDNSHQYRRNRFFKVKTNIGEIMDVTPKTRGCILRKIEVGEYVILDSNNQISGFFTKDETEYLHKKKLINQIPL